MHSSQRDSRLFLLVPVALILALALLPAAAPAATWRVPDDAPTIRAGIDSASAGDTVLVEAGTYYEYNIAVTEGIYITSETGRWDCVTVDANSLGRVFDFTSVSGKAYLVGFTITHGLTNYGGGMMINTAVVDVTDCRIVDNHASSQGGGVLVQGPGTAADVTFDGCVFDLNVAGSEGGGVAAYYRWDLDFTGCTFYANAAPEGGGIYTYNNIGLGYTDLDHCIIAFSTQGTAAYCGAGTAPTFTCSDIYGNAGGDWVGCIAGQAGTNGNISNDPKFCGAAGGDFSLAGDSPCLHAVCGQMGPFGRGCFGERPVITRVSDVGNDQGRQVRIVWERSSWDYPGSEVGITGYTIFRREDEFLAWPGTPPVEHEMYDPEDHITIGAAGWDEVGHVLARGDSVYQAVVPTLCDSTDEGICWSVFMVSATTSDPYYYFDSPPDSGYSIDNLAPSPPPGLMMTSPTELAWEEVPDEDFDYYSVYGSAEPVLDGNAVLIGYSVGTTKDVTGHVYDYYHVTATDFSGNEGEEASVNNTFAGVPGIPDADDIPAAFALRESRPNPFSSSTVIGFDLPEETNARVTIYDTHGRIIIKLTNNKYEAGRYAVTWQGEDAAGNRVASGVYFVRMEAGKFQAMKKAMLLR
jgi:hypothetical protein